MKEYIKFIIPVIISCLFIYLLGAFANATFDITLWSSEERGRIATFMFVCMVFTLLFYGLSMIKF